MDLRDLLLEVSDNVFARTSRRLVGLTDTELLWEPTPNCWSVRERVDGTVRVDWAPYIGGGEVTASGFIRTTSTGGDALQPPPFTNLAWRIWHLTQVYGRSQNERVLTGRAGEEMAQAPRRTAAEAVADLSAAHHRWRAILASMTDEQLDEPLAGGRHAAATKVGCVMNMIDEFTHHGAELGVLRDLYAHSSNAAPSPTPRAAGSERCISPQQPAKATSSNASSNVVRTPERRARSRGAEGRGPVSLGRAGFRRALRARSCVRRAAR